ncbi:uncharacterized protein LOC124297932 isoform X4 [Neodiprion virginianus]|uniref:uncharacterized protein LOC124297932 isoform X4 n=1 Tax=Neodiprion virginianus TaxID=2961670 RepID=UPI001EE6F53C|nr:uncharacterized protein LOC124297932 isoform X4 [Neodiprion virginianus]
MNVRSSSNMELIHQHRVDSEKIVANAEPKTLMSHDSDARPITCTSLGPAGTRRAKYESGRSPVKAQSPATPYQLDHMIAYLERNPHIALRKFRTPGSSHDPSASWEQLAEELNALWKNGAPKDTKKWKNVWYDQRNAAVRKIKNIHQVGTSNERSHLRLQKLNVREKRILALLKYSDDHDVRKEILHTAEEELVNALPESGLQKDLKKGPKDGSIPSGMQSTRSDIENNYTDQELLEILEGFENTELGSIMLNEWPTAGLVPLSPLEVEANLPDTRKSPSKREPSFAPAPEVTELASNPVPPTDQDSSFAALEVTEPVRKLLLLRTRSSSSAAIGGTGPASKLSFQTTGNSLDAALDAMEENERVTEPVALKPLSLKVQNSQYEPVEHSDSTPEPLPPKERNPLPAPTVIGAGTSSERSQSLHQEESSCTAAVNEAAAVAKPGCPLSSQESTTAVQKSPEPEPSSSRQKLHQQPCYGRPRKIQKVAKNQDPCPKHYTLLVDV